MSKQQAWLLIDDDDAFLQVLQRSLGRQGIEAKLAHGHQEAKTALLEGTFHRCVLDLNLAGESGLQLLPEILDMHPDLEILMLTGYGSIATAVEAIKRGACNYLCKPADADDVLTALLSEQADPETLVPEHPMSVDRLQWEHIQRVLAEHEGNISATARALGMHRRTLQRKLQKRPVRR